MDFGKSLATSLPGAFSSILFVVLRDLHSFPTRRSSDLISAGSPNRFRGMYCLTPSFTLSFSTSDRKSTRLNSSHRCISYAVFCLKKKRKLQDHDQRKPLDEAAARHVAYGLHQSQRAD